MPLRVGLNGMQRSRNIVQGKPNVIALWFDHKFILQVAKETTTISVVATFGDPVAAGIVQNMARPERNITGVSLDAGIEMQGKHLEILRQAVPSATRVAYLSNRAEWDGAWGQTVRDAGLRSGVSIIGIPLDRSAGEPEYRQAFETMAQQKVEALMANGLPPNSEHREPDTRIDDETSLAIHYLVDGHCRKRRGIFGLCARLSALFRYLGG
jgi:putative ABC transport system substrate-binding protein